MRLVGLAHPILVLVRDSIEDNGATADERAEEVRHWMIGQQIRGSVFIIPNVEGVYYGRDVGYNVMQIVLDADVEAISGTELRDREQKTKDL